MTYVWLTVIALALIVEASTTALVAIWFVPSAVVAAILAGLKVDLIWQLVVFFVLSIVFVIFARRIFSKTIAPKHTPTNADALIGETGIVVKDIDGIDFGGLVKVKGQTWSAKSEKGEKIENGSTVEILSIEGVRLTVKER